MLVLKTTFNTENLAQDVKKLLGDKTIEQLVKVAISDIENSISDEIAEVPHE